MAKSDRRMPDQQVYAAIRHLAAHLDEDRFEAASVPLGLGRIRPVRRARRPRQKPVAGPVTQPGEAAPTAPAPKAGRRKVKKKKPQAAGRPRAVRHRKATTPAGLFSLLLLDAGVILFSLGAGLLLSTTVATLLGQKTDLIQVVAWLRGLSPWLVGSGLLMLVCSYIFFFKLLTGRTPGQVFLGGKKRRPAGKTPDGGSRPAVGN